jgi:hypothetical protein
MKNLPDPANPTDPTPALTAGPTPDQRTALVRAYQARCFRRVHADPLGANLGIMNASLIELGNDLTDHVRAYLAEAGPAAMGDPQFARGLDMVLKVMRQSDRFSQLERQPPPADPPSDRVRRGEDSGF